MNDFNIKAKILYNKKYYIIVQRIIDKKYWNREIISKKIIHKVGTINNII